MKALITGASSGLGWEYAILLDSIGYDIIAVARREDKLLELKNMLKNNTEILVADLSREEECLKLTENYPDIDILINNAGFGVFGEFSLTDSKKELSMIDVNIRAMHILFKSYLKLFLNKDKGYILNVSSSAAFFPGPLFSAYYASKAYIYRLTRGVIHELKKSKSNVQVSVFLPGPILTEFNEKAGVNPGKGAITPQYAAEISIKKMFKKKHIIVPGFATKFTRIFSKLLPECITEKIVYHLQQAKKCDSK